NTTRSTTNGVAGGKFDPVNSTTPADNEGYGPAFKGYSMGPSYYGKTFYMWPPDPRYHPSADPTNPHSTNTAKDTSGRWMGDWRKRFFYLNGTTTACDDNTALWDATGNWKQSNQTGSYSVNYNAILAWIKTGAQVLPPNLRAGRLL